MWGRLAKLINHAQNYVRWRKCNYGSCNIFYFFEFTYVTLKDSYVGHALQPATTNVIVKGITTNPARLGKPATRFQNHEPSVFKCTDML